MRTISGVTRVAHIVEILGDARHDLGVTEIAAKLGVHKTTASRLLGTLADSGLVERNPESGKYRLGVGLIRLAAVALNGLDVIQAARPTLEALAERARETVNLAIMDQGRVLYVDQITSLHHSIVMANWVGRRSPAHCSSSGKVLLAFGDPDRAEQVLRGPLEKLTTSTITSPERLRGQLAAARRCGWARAMEELEDGLATVAAPIMGPKGVVAAVSVSGPSFRITAHDQPRLAKLAIEAAAAVSGRINHRAIPKPRS